MLICFLLVFVEVMIGFDIGVFLLIKSHQMISICRHCIIMTVNWQVAKSRLMQFSITVKYMQRQTANVRAIIIMFLVFVV